MSIRPSLETRLARLETASSAAAPLVIAIVGVDEDPNAAVERACEGRIVDERTVVVVINLHALTGAE